MGNFLRRLISFILGMVFSAVVLSGTVIAVGYSFYKNTTLGDLGVSEETVDLGGLNDATIEDLVALVVSASNDPSSYTIGDLEENYGLNVEDMLTSFGMDVSAIHPDDVKALKKITPFALSGENGFNEFLNSVNFGVIFGFIPKQDGKYPLFSDGARSKLRSYTLGELFTANEAGEMPIANVLSSMPIGSILSSLYDETYDPATATYAYVSEEGGILDGISELSFNVVTKFSGDLGYEFNEGSLKKLGSTPFGELVGVTEEASGVMKALSDKTLADIFVKVGDVYNFELMGLLNGIHVGELMGMTYCDGTTCGIEHAHALGWYDGSGNLVESTDIAGELMNNLYGLSVEDLTNGSFDITGLTSGLYLGKALGYEIGEKAGYCPSDCADATEGHVHEYYWLQGGEYVGAMNNGLANISIDAVMNGSLNIESVLGEVKVGELMGMTYCDGTNCDLTHAHVEGWYDGSGNLVSSTDIAGELMVKLYALTVNDLISGSFNIEELTGGIYLGKAFGYEIGEKAGYCPSDCSDIAVGHKHEYYWVQGGEYVGAMNNALANIALADAMNGSLDITGVLNELKVGELMGMTYCDGTTCELSHAHELGWYDKAGVKVNASNVADELTVKLYDLTVNDLTNGSFNLEELTDGIYLGKAFGYEIGSKAGYCPSDCADLAVGHKHEYYWVNGSEYVGAMNNALANIALKDAMNGTLNISEVLNDLSVGDLMGYEYNEGENAWYKGGVKFVPANMADEIMVKLYSVKVGELTGGTFNIANLTNGIYFGKALGYEIGEKAGYCPSDCTNSTAGHVHNFYWVNGSEYVGAMNNAIANVSLSSAMSSSMNLESVLGDIKLGEIMGNEYNEVENAWYKGGVKINYSSLTGVDKITYNLYSMQFSSVLNGNINLTSALGSLYVGEIMNYKGDAVNGWYLVDGVTPVDNLQAVIADIKMQDLLNGNVDIKTKINGLTLGDVMDTNGSSMLKLLDGVTITDLPTAIDGLFIGDIMGYKKCTGVAGTCEITEAHVHNGKWYNGGAEVTGVYGTISNYTIKNLTEGALTNMKIGDLVNTEGNAVLSLLADETLTSLPLATNQLKLGDIMGYEKCTGAAGTCEITEAHVHNGKWYNGGEEVTGINAKLAIYTIADVSSGGFSGIIDTLTMGDVFNEDKLNKGAFSLMYLGDVDGKSYTQVGLVPVSEISERTVKGMKESVYYDLEQAGVELISDADEAKIYAFYCSALCPTERKPTDLSSADGWKKEKTLTAIISDVLSIINVPV